jgi:hypothetical protein
VYPDPIGRVIFENGSGRLGDIKISLRTVLCLCHEGGHSRVRPIPVGLLTRYSRWVPSGFSGHYSLIRCVIARSIRGALTAPKSKALACRWRSRRPGGAKWPCKTVFAARDEPYLHLYPHSSSGGPGMPFQGRGQCPHLCPRQRRSGHATG